MASLVNFDSNLVDSSTVITVNNRAFNYGDGLFETMRFMNGQVQFIDRHFMRLSIGMEMLGMKVPSHFTADYISREIKRLVNDRDLRGSARIKMVVFRKEGGFYLPDTNDFSFLITCDEIPNGYTLNAGGVKLGVFDEVLLQESPYANIKHLNRLPNILAGNYCKEVGFDDCLMLNGKRDIVESMGSNIFLVKKGNLTTPKLEDGCLAGVMRSVIIDIAGNAGMSVSEESLTPESVEEADEVFLTNAISGVKWVGAYKRRRYLNTKSKILIMFLNKKGV
ncbi:MAG: aminotransferase class IV [Flavobacteriales bacterium]|nr:aminotransferase class IV [Flavobacteriales bacterium]